MNKTKRYLIMAAAIINLINIIVSLVLAILVMTNKEVFEDYQQLLSMFSFSYSIIYSIFSLAIGLVGSILLLYSVRSKGKYFRRSQGFYIAGFIIVVLLGGVVSWILLFISLFIPDVVVMNTRSEIRIEERMEEKQNKEKEMGFVEKKRKIEELQRLRDSGVITEEEYKEKLFELL